MAKIKLGNRPKSFTRTVTFPMLDGTEGSIECVFKYRTRTEFGAFIDEIAEQAGAQPKAPEEEKFSLAALMAKTRDTNADYLLRVLDGWNLDVELSRDALAQLADECPAAATAIMETYRVAVTEGRLGN